MARKPIGTFKGQAVSADPDTKTVFLITERGTEMTFRDWWDYNGNFRLWVQRRVDWTIK